MRSWKEIFSLGEYYFHSLCFLCQNLRIGTWWYERPVLHVLLQKKTHICSQSLLVSKAFSPSSPSCCYFMTWDLGNAKRLKRLCSHAHDSISIHNMCCVLDTLQSHTLIGLFLPHSFATLRKIVFCIDYKCILG